MDYVVFGIGFGATILVLGLLLRDFGPKLRFRRSSDGGEVLGAEELVAKVSWTRFCTALGTVLALAGAAFLLITLVAMILVVSDDTGLWIMASAYGLLLIVMAYWTWAYFHRFGSYGILPERQEPEPAFSAPRPEPETRYSTPPAQTSGEDDSDELESDEPDQTASGVEVAGDRAETDTDDQPPPGNEPEPEPRLQTPEERLAHAESPINHGSAEGDLDLAASGPRRPGTFAPRQAERVGDPTEGSDSDDTEADEDKDRADA